MPTFSNCFSAMWNWASDYVHFNMAAVFISGLISSNSFMKTAFEAFLVWYLLDVWKKPSLRKAAVFGNVIEGMILFSSIVAEHKAVDRIGHFWLIIYTVPCLIIVSFYFFGQ
ncbi:hypothetical protein DITRI_Ditri05aG0078300 [Diplodiscus trichospermus]